MRWNEFVRRVSASNGRPPDAPAPNLILALDPGLTTGYCIFASLQLQEVGTFKTVDVAERLITSGVNVVVIESYRVYPHRVRQHIGSTVPTLRIIGAMEYIARRQGLTPVFQTAAQAKGFCTDTRLKEWGLYQKGTDSTHKNDAIRHACYYILFRVLASV